LLISRHVASEPPINETRVKYLVAAPWEADSAIAAWLISRYVSQNAEFASVIASTPLIGDQARYAIDIAGGQYVRTNDDSAAGAVMRAHKIADPCAQTLHRFSRVLELSAWRKGQFPEAVMFEQYLRPTLEAITSNKHGTDVLFKAIDQWCTEQQ
jgi:hypothetical protein